jgi:hypothetical protein
MADFGGTETGDKEKGEKKEKGKKEKTEQAVSSKPLMQEEDRNTGQIQWFLYALYVKAAGGWFWALFILFMLLAEQAAQSESVPQNVTMHLLIRCLFQS